MLDLAPLTVLVLGNSRPYLDQIERWNDQGFLTLSAVWISPYPDEWDTWMRQINMERIDILFLAETSPALWEFLQLRKADRTLVLQPDTFWVLEMLMEQRAKVQEMHAILSSAYEGVQVVDAAGVVRYVNPAFTRITGVEAECRIGSNIFEVSPQGALAKTLETGKPVLGWRNTVLDTQVEVISNAFPIYVDGNLAGAVTTFREVAEKAEKPDKVKFLKKESPVSPAVLNGYATRHTFADIIGESPVLRETIELAKSVASSSSTLLITGESGTGKELFAQAIHSASRPDQPFVAVNCAAIPESLLESELFGYEKGAFTHASQKKPGKMELAHGGTLFLDEIGDMSYQLQAKLLRFLQTKQFERVGGTKPVEVQVRIIAATNCDLEQMVRQNRFRQDLYYRLNVLRLELPPLRSRLSDIPAIARHLLGKICKRLQIPEKAISNKALALFTDYHWPGNIRELESVLERLVHECPHETISAEAVVRQMKKLVAGQANPCKQADKAENEPILNLRTLEKRALIRAMERFGTTVEGKKQAASVLGISLATLYKKLKEYELDRKGG